MVKSFLLLVMAAFLLAGCGGEVAEPAFAQNFRSSVRHGEGVMAELQLSALLANLVHWEIHNPVPARCGTMTPKL